MKLTLTILLISLLSTSVNYSQTAKTQRYNPFFGTVVFSVEGGTTLASADYSGLGVDYLGRLSIEYFFPVMTRSGFGVRAFGNAGFLSGDDSDQLVLSSETSFEFNSAKLNKAAYPKLDKPLTHMNKFPMSRWKIVGYADNVGPEDGNIEKSQRRAESVLDYFVSKGIQELRFEVIGMGSKDPLAGNSTPEGRAQNRRVENKRIDI